MGGGTLLGSAGSCWGRALGEPQMCPGVSLPWLVGPAYLGLPGAGLNPGGSARAGPLQGQERKVRVLTLF